MVRRDLVLLLLVALFVALTVTRPGGVMGIARIYRLVDWTTIASLAGIITITTGIKESGLFEGVAGWALDRLASERSLALFLVSLTAVSSAFLTNDIALVIVVPFTLSLQGLLQNDIKKVVVFEGIAANVGSALTPIGNPQNMVLWRDWGISFLAFVWHMAPLALVSVPTLLLFAALVFRGRALHTHRAGDTRYDRRLAIWSLGLLLGCVVAFEVGASVYVLPAILLAYVALDRDVLGRVDWSIIFILTLMFVDFRILSEMKWVSRWVWALDLGHARGVFISSVWLSQAISNVPTAIFLSRFSHNWRAILYGVNIGGNGLATASLANLIALRMVPDRRIWMEFHKYSLIYLLITAVLIYLWL
ncbi:MAG: anion transporter [Chloroflexi bacterium]|nr:anion transporter [Chloroflexota bacterium]